jgi:hypothetical protein
MIEKSDIEKCICGTFYVSGDYLYCPNCKNENESAYLIESFVIDQAVEEYYLTKHNKKG